jgi:hypothetical protein
MRFDVIISVPDSTLDSRYSVWFAVSVLYGRSVEKSGEVFAEQGVLRDFLLQKGLGRHILRVLQDMI